MIILTALFLAAYLLVIIPLWIGNDSLPEYSSEGKEPEIAFSVIIPFRNEAEQLPFLLKSLIKLEYPSNLFELIFVDDDSTDDSAAIISEALSHTNLQFSVIANQHNSGSPKKDAIRAAIIASTSDWILTTDADCIVPPQWLLVYSNYIETTNGVLIAGPVDYLSNKSLLHNFQRLDGWSLQLTAMGSFGLDAPLLCNGANLAYKKEAFQAVHGFTGNDHIASGDDVFILQKLKKQYPESIQYLKSEDAIVCTRPENSWRDVVIQRIRWASKIGGQKEWRAVVIGIVLFTTNVYLLLLPVLFIIAPHKWLAFLLYFLLKFIVDALFLNKACNFFKGEHLAGEFLMSFLIYPVVTTVAGIGSLLGKYSWKGRTFKKQT
ncbi:glycosyltransferase [Constantimarinum furrinae]|uniref:Glycosyl transferase n=1 Tax=Constantimarinum furrinae TaxID=2562285 RepID=A0A7G8PS59_9FLAO|nr:glycosyltransferase [Constantimarinum furrinae]QNJ97175.1 Glycosyl transferase [Constantimarinum furrinae]